MSQTLTRAVVLCGCVLSVAIARAEKPPQATLLCGVFKKQQVDYLVPTDDGRKITKTIDCALSLGRAAKGPLTAQIWVKTGDHEAERHTDAITKGGDLAAELKPNVDFAPCTNFEIHARIDNASGMIWEDTQPVTQSCATAAPIAAAKTPAPAAAKKGATVKAKFECLRTLDNGKSVPITADGSKIEGKGIYCSVISKDARLLGGRAIIQTTWHQVGGAAKTGREHHGEPSAEGDEYIYQFALDKGDDWDTCAPDITVPLVITDADGAIVFQSQKSWAQSCAIATAKPAAATAKPAAASDSARWDEHALPDIPKDARGVMDQFINAAVDSDPPALASLAGRGVKKGKKLLVGPDLYDLAKATGIKPLLGCDDENRNCKTWGVWQTHVKSPTEIWIYSNSDSGYGVFACAVFTKTGGEWKWTGVRTYDVAP